MIEAGQVCYLPFYGCRNWDSETFCDLSKVAQPVCIPIPVPGLLLYRALLLQLLALPGLHALGVWIRQGKSARWHGDIISQRPPCLPPTRMWPVFCCRGSPQQQGWGWRDVFYIGILHLCRYWFLSQRVPSAFYLIMLLIFIPVLRGFLSLSYRGAGFQGYQKSIDWRLSLAFL